MFYIKNIKEDKIFLVDKLRIETTPTKTFFIFKYNNNEYILTSSEFIITNMEEYRKQQINKL